MQASGGVSAAELQGTSTVAGEERELLGASIDHHQHQVADARAALDDASAAVAAAQEDLATAQQTASEHQDEVTAAADALADTRRELRAATEDERAPLPTATPWQLSIEGPSAFTAAELVAWYEAQGQGAQATVPIGRLIRSFLEYGEAEGIRGDMAFAQSIHETGWFTNTDTVHANNFAGIGHCDSCAAGYPYPTAETGVLAQIQLLKSYAEEYPLYHLPRADPGLDGPTGCCPAWSDLGGVWATDSGYGHRILGRYAEMLEWLVARRTVDQMLAPDP
jgi:hypothetical protein